MVVVGQIIQCMSVSASPGMPGMGTGPWDAQRAWMASMLTLLFLGVKYAQSILTVCTRTFHVIAMPATQDLIAHIVILERMCLNMLASCARQVNMGLSLRM